MPFSLSLLLLQFDVLEFCGQTKSVVCFSYTATKAADEGGS